MKDIYDMMDELGREMVKLRRDYPSLFPVRILSLEGNSIKIEDMVQAMIRLGDAFGQISYSMAPLIKSTDEFTLAIAREQARREQQASWLERAKGWLRRK